jgi:hypothetical protein
MTMILTIPTKRKKSGTKGARTDAFVKRLTQLSVVNVQRNPLTVAVHSPRETKRKILRTMILAS